MNEESAMSKLMSRLPVVLIPSVDVDRQKRGEDEDVEVVRLK